MSYGNPLTLSKLTDLLPKLTGRLTGCPPVLIISTLHDIARDFCRETGALRMPLGPFDFVAGQSDYRIEFPILASLLTVHKVLIKDTPQHPTTYTIYPDADMYQMIRFAFAPTKTEDDMWSVDVSMVPDEGADDYPLEFLQQWSHAIVAGTLAEIMADDGKRWANATMAGINMQKYRLAKQDAAIKRLSANTVDGRLSFQNDEHFSGSFA